MNYIVIIASCVLFSHSVFFAENTLKDFFLKKSNDTEPREQSEEEWREEDRESEENWREENQESEDDDDEQDLDYANSEDSYFEEEQCCYCPPSYNRIFLTGEYLFWRAWQDLDLAGKGTLFPGRVKHIDFDWKNGYRAGVGAESCDGWATEILYTCINPKGSKKVRGSDVFPLMIPQFVSGGFSLDLEDDVFESSTAESIFQLIQSKVNIDFNTLDLSLGRNFSSSPCFRFEAKIGFEGARVQEKLSTFYEGDLRVLGNEGLDEVDERLPFSIFTSQKWRFKGGGIKLGAAAEYRSYCGFVFFAKGCYNLLYGKYRNVYEQEVLDISIDTVAPEFLVVFREYYNVFGKENFNSFVSNVQLDVGFGFMYESDCAFFRIDAGWEMFYWPSIVELRRGLTGRAAQSSLNFDLFDVHFTSPSVSQKVPGSLGMQGVVVRATLGF